MNTRILELLTAVYGEGKARDVVPRLDQLLAQHRPNLPSIQSTSRKLSVTERDALLITYGDQVAEPGQPPLKTLAGFLEQHARGAISGVHILPFYPYSSDDGFSVIDYVQVDPALGAWDDVARLGQTFDLMFDAVFNHISAGSDWFQGFLTDDPAYADFFVTVEGDPVRLMQILGNLLGNAAKYTPAGGSVVLSVIAEADWLHLSICDNGIGISANALPFIFEPFVQDVHAVGFSGAGLGIGLTVVRELVESHGGTVTGMSEGDGQGSEFVVMLPMVKS